MSAEWYDKTQDFTDRDKQFLLLAYRNTLCGRDEGQQVLCHIKTMIDESFEDANMPDIAKVAARRLYDTILHNCGIVNNLKIIKALSGVAAGFNIPEEEEEDLLNA